MPASTSSRARAWPGPSVSSPRSACRRVRPNAATSSSPSSPSRVAAAGVLEERGFTSFDSVFHGQRGKSPELGSPSAVHPLEPWTLRENMVHVIQPNPITRDHRAGLQLGAAVIVRPNGGETVHNYPFVFPVCG